MIVMVMVVVMGLMRSGSADDRAAVMVVMMIQFCGGENDGDDADNAFVAVARVASKSRDPVQYSDTSTPTRKIWRKQLTQSQNLSSSKLAEDESCLSNTNLMPLIVVCFVHQGQDMTRK